ncbi:octanoyltransferase [Buchnera aphidicola (Melanaphis sacchari)]|uniref:Octanoyltransferase n=1 Tax=Buchnera aphidicola (Melanaphis sacchari) TaxID=2173854 RepID=A0A2U8DFD8_9GAMM|nr:lipoyl(octanoyl) transferase LipB [Buchnera aphidicola]AWH90518.1 octanoyltransferase [Buchnera aphidicola (Melanaphis sacchari)]
MKKKFIFFKNLGLRDWFEVVNQMHIFTQSRNFNTFDEIWFVEHYPIFTQGLVKKSNSVVLERKKYLHNIPLVLTDRGGQITYHGPGQQIIYFLIDLKRRKINIRQFINIIQTLIIDTLNYFSIDSYPSLRIPGIYINKKKVCSIGLRISKGCTLHGLSLNINMNLTPFTYISPCGDINMRMTQIKNFNPYVTISEIRLILIKKLSKLLNVQIINKKLQNRI